VPRLGGHHDVSSPRATLNNLDSPRMHAMPVACDAPWLASRQQSNGEIPPPPEARVTWDLAIRRRQRTWRPRSLGWGLGGHDGLTLCSGSIRVARLLVVAVAGGCRIAGADVVVAGVFLDVYSSSEAGDIIDLNGLCASGVSLGYPAVRPTEAAPYAPTRRFPFTQNLSKRAPKGTRGT
jgi:hypothetical protein